MDNNNAFIARIGDIQPIVGADRIVSAKVVLNGTPITQVVIGKGDFEEGDLVCYFDSNLCLSDIAIEKINKQNPKFNEENFEGIERYLARGNRIRTIKLKGQISDGLVIKPQLLGIFCSSPKEYMTLEEGFSFTTLGDTEICKKYIPPVRGSATTASGKKGRKKKLISRIISKLWNFHCDTSQLLRNIHVINPGDLISISSKWHGTSGIFSYTKVLRKLAWYEKILIKLGAKLDLTTEDTIYASRTVIKNDNNFSSFYSEDIWAIAGKKNFESKLHLGETVYFEIVGYLPNGGFIQKQYDYGCANGEHRVKVYRITLTSDDGTVTEYSWSAMKQRCAELNVEMVEEIYYGKAFEMYKDIPVDENWRQAFVTRLQEQFLEGDCQYCKNKVPSEGIVLRIEGLHINVYKLKSKRFILKESELKEKEDFVDIEDAQTINSEYAEMARLPDC